MTHSIEQIQSDVLIEEAPTSSNIESIETDDDVLIIDGEQESTSPKRRRNTNCEDCDIPFITKKEFKVS